MQSCDHDTIAFPSFDVAVFCWLFKKYRERERKKRFQLRIYDPFWIRPENYLVYHPVTHIGQPDTPEKTQSMVWRYSASSGGPTQGWRPPPPPCCSLSSDQSPPSGDPWLERDSNEAVLGPFIALSMWPPPTPTKRLNPVFARYNRKRAQISRDFSLPCFRPCMDCTGIYKSAQASAEEEPRETAS